MWASKRKSNIRLSWKNRFIFQGVQRSYQNDFRKFEKDECWMEQVQLPWKYSASFTDEKHYTYNWQIVANLWRQKSYLHCTLTCNRMQFGSTYWAFLEDWLASTTSLHHSVNALRRSVVAKHDLRESWNSYMISSFGAGNLNCGKLSTLLQSRFSLQPSSLHVELHFADSRRVTRQYGWI